MCLFRESGVFKQTQVPNTKIRAAHCTAHQNQTQETQGQQSAFRPAPASETTAGGQPPPVCLFFRALVLFTGHKQLNKRPNKQDGTQHGDSRRKQPSTWFQ